MRHVRDPRKGRLASKGLVTTLAVAIVCLLAFEGLALATQGQGLTMQLLDRGKINRRVRVRTDNVNLQTTGPVDVFTQRITLEPNGDTGWHSHPGPVLVALQQGSVISYEANCRPRAYSAGQGFVDPSHRGHIMKNFGTVPAVLYITALLPPDVPLRTDEPAPATCFR